MYLWDRFLELSQARGSNGFAPNTISYTEIAAFAELEGIEFTPWEVDALRRLDALWCKVYNGRSSRTQPSRKE